MNLVRATGVAIVAMPILIIAWLHGQGAQPEELISAAPPSANISTFIKTPLKTLFPDLTVGLKVNERCGDDDALCIYLVGNVASDAPIANSFVAHLNAAGALAIGSNKIFISEIYLAQLFQQAAIDVTQYASFLKHLDFSEQANIDAAAKATGLSVEEIASMASGKISSAEKLRDYENNPRSNYQAGRIADRASLLQLLSEEARASGVIPTDEDTADSISVLTRSGYPENVALLLSWTLYHEYRHLQQARNPIARLWSHLRFGLRGLEEDADGYATEKVDLLINRLVQNTRGNIEKAIALQSAQKASRSFWTLRLLTDAVQKIVGIPLSRMTFLIDKECSDSASTTTSYVLSVRSRFFVAVETANVFRSRSLLLSNPEFDLLHDQIRANDGAASHEFDYYRGIHPINPPALGGRGSQLWNDENMEWSIQKALFNGSRGFLPDWGITDVSTPMKTELAAAIIRKAAPEIIEQDVANFCGGTCKLFVAQTADVNVRIELFPDPEGFVKSLNLVAVEANPIDEKLRARQIVFDLVTELMANGKTVVGNGPESTASYIRQNVLPEGFERMEQIQATCGVNTQYYGDGPSMVRVQQSDQVYYQVQFYGVKEPADNTDPPISSLGTASPATTDVQQ